MSMDHSFLITTGLPLRELAEQITAELPASGVLADDETLKYNPDFISHAIDKTDGEQILNWSVMEPSDFKRKISQAICQFTPDVNLSFQVTKEPELYNTGWARMLDIVGWMMARHPDSGALFLMFDGERPMLARRPGGPVLLSRIGREEGNWRDEDLEKLKFPWEWGDLPGIIDDDVIEDDW